MEADDDLTHARATMETYLGCPLKAYSRVIFMQSTISDVVDAKGWLPWEHAAPPDMIYYGTTTMMGQVPRCVAG